MWVWTDASGDTSSEDGEAVTDARVRAALRRLAIERAVGCKLIPWAAHATRLRRLSPVSWADDGRCEEVSLAGREAGETGHVEGEHLGCGRCRR